MTTTDDIEVCTTESVPERSIAENLGVVRGNSVRARNVGRDITQALRNLVGGELPAYSRLMTDTREQALGRMADEARELDADAVVNVRFETSQVSGSSAELLAYGTAVALE